MNKTELISQVADVTKVSKKDATAVVDATFEIIANALAKGDKVQLVGFGTFEARERAAREGINPLTKEKITISACKNPVFKAGKALKNIVNQ